MAEAGDGISDSEKVRIKYKEDFLDTLKDVDWTGEFSVGGIIQGAPSTTLEITGAGLCHFPLYEAQAKQLINVFQRSPFENKGSRTVIDLTLRNLWELNPEYFKIMNPNWEKYLEETVYPIIAKGMGIKHLVSGTLKKLLLFEPGSFFLPHKDSPRELGMFGTLVIQLPSLYKGGKWAVVFDSVKKIYDNSTGDIHSNTGREFSTYYLAFHCSCLNETIPITSGYRICLVYNLICPRAIPQPGFVGTTEDKLARLFDRWPSHDLKKMVYILSNKYKKDSLSFKKLKGFDNSVVGMITSAAKKCAVIVYLAMLTECITISPKVEVELMESQRKRSRFEILNDPLQLEMLEKRTILVSFVSTREEKKPIELMVDVLDEVVPQDCFPEQFTPEEETEGIPVLVFFPHDNIYDLDFPPEESESLGLDVLIHKYKSYISSSESQRSTKLEKLKEWATIIAPPPEGEEAAGNSTNWSRVEEMATNGYNSDEQAVGALTAITALNDFVLFRRFLKKYFRLRDATIPFLVAHCEKIGWNMVSPIFKYIVSSNDKANASRILLVMMQNNTGSMSNEDGTLTRLVDCILYQMICLSAYANDYANKPWIERKFFQNMLRLSMFSHLNINIDMREYMMKYAQPLVYVERVAVPALYPILSEEGFVTPAKWVPLLKLCTAHFQTLVKSELLVKWNLNYKISCTCNDCKRLQDYLKSNEQVARFPLSYNRYCHIRNRLARCSDLMLETERGPVSNVLIITKTHMEMTKQRREFAVKCLPYLNSALGKVQD